MHYGTVPIVRSTGGLKDTVFDCDDPRAPKEKRNGFVFSEPKPEPLIAAIHRALKNHQTNPAAHQLLIKNGMLTDFSWKKPAKEYLALYAQVTRK